MLLKDAKKFLQCLPFDLPVIKEQSIHFSVSYQDFYLDSSGIDIIIMNVIFVYFFENTKQMFFFFKRRQKHVLGNEIVNKLFGKYKYATQTYKNYDYVIP